ncbi:MAG: phosphate regulon transcriptional regulator PhoB [Rhizobiaceae bacterium]
MSALAQPTVLIVEDESSQVELLKFNFEKAGYATRVAMDGEEGLLQAEEHNPDLIILDWMLPELSGIEVCRQLKRNQATRAIPILMLTARGEESDRVRGLDTGADDFVVKPYSVKELLARARAMMRRSNPISSGEVVTYGDIKIDSEQRKVFRGETLLKLGPTEYRLLSVFISRPGRVWSRDQLLERVWPHDLDIDLRTVDVHVGRLRKAIRIAGKTDPIRTVRAAGYSLDLEP